MYNKHTAETKKAAVKLVLDDGLSVKMVATRTGLTLAQLYALVRDEKQRRAERNRV